VGRNGRVRATAWTGRAGSRGSTLAARVEYRSHVDGRGLAGHGDYQLRRRQVPPVACAAHEAVQVVRLSVRVNDDVLGLLQGSALALRKLDNAMRLDDVVRDLQVLGDRVHAEFPGRIRDAVRHGSGARTRGGVRGVQTVGSIATELGNASCNN
jgi:hypothetical protein